MSEAGLSVNDELTVLDQIIPAILKWAADNVPEGNHLDIFATLKDITKREYSIEEVTKLVDNVYNQLFSNIKVSRGDFTSQNENIPKYDGNSEETRKDFQAMVRKFIRSVPSEKKLLFLNKIQKKTPFNLMNPNLKYKKDFVYGYADLIRFSCSPVESGEVARFIKNSPGMAMEFNETEGKFVPSKSELPNPFYNPIRYQIPDIEGNKRLEEIIIGSRKFQEQKMMEIRSLRQYIGKKNVSEADARARLNAIIKIYVDIYKYQTNPVFLSMFVPGQERPISQYRKTHFKQLLEQLVTRKRLHPATKGRHAPEGFTGFKISGPELDRLNMSYKPDEKRKSSKKHRKHYKK